MASSETSHEIGLDHVGLFAPAIEPLAAQYERLGFSLTPLAQHARPDAPGMPSQLRGTGNRCAMLEQGYIELLAIVDPALDTLGVPEALKRYTGMHILAFRIEDPAAVATRLRDDGFEIAQTYLERSVSTPDADAVARFTQIRPVDGSLPEGRVFMLRHETPDLIWQARYLSHPNTAVAVAEVVVAVGDIAEACGRYDRYFGQSAEIVNGSASYVLKPGRFTLKTVEQLRDDAPSIKPPVLPYPAILIIDVADLATAEALLKQNGVPYVGCANRLCLDPREAGGVMLVFRRAKQ